MNMLKCSICNKEIKESKFNSKPLCSDECFFADFWLEKIEYVNDCRSVRVKGHHYWIGQPDNGFKGHGGKKFKINFKDGKEIIHNCLWYQGEIPTSFRTILTDNATIKEL